MGVRSTPLTLAQVRPLAEAAAREANVPAWLVLAIAQHESGGFYPSAFRGELHLADGSHGLMQLLLSTAKGVGYAGTSAGSWDALKRTGTGLYDPYTNLRYGAKHLRKLLNATAGDYEQAVSAYNAGLGNAKKATSPVRFCEMWKSSAPSTGRVLDRDCQRIRNVKVGEWLNQPYVDSIERLAVMHGGTLKPANLGNIFVRPVPVEGGGESRPAGTVPGSPSPTSGRTMFVVRSALVIGIAAVSTILFLAFRR